jgi:hypothetical protein
MSSATSTSIPSGTTIISQLFFGMSLIYAEP